MKITGFDDLINDLEQTLEKAKQLDGTTQQFELTDDIVAKYTDQISVDALFIAANISENDSEDITDKKLDLYLQKLPIGSLENLITELTGDFVMEQLDL